MQNGMLSGSARNYPGFPCEKLKSTLQETGMFGFLEGDEGAFGYAISPKNIAFSLP